MTMFDTQHFVIYLNKGWAKWVWFSLTGVFLVIGVMKNLPQISLTSIWLAPNDGEFFTGDVYCIRVEDFIDLKLIFANFCHILWFSSSLFTKIVAASITGAPNVFTSKLSLKRKCWLAVASELTNQKTRYNWIFHCWSAALSSPQ